MTVTHVARDFRPITVEEFRSSGLGLAREHARESEPGRMPDLEPDWLIYENVEEQGLLVAFGAFAGDSLVGYVVGYVAPNPHYLGQVQLQMDLLYVDPDFRGRMIGRRLLGLFSAKGHELGVDRILYTAKVNSTLHCLLVRTEGLVPEDIIYTENL